MGFLWWAIPVVLTIWIIAMYNRLIRGRNHCDEAWSGIDTELKRRYNLIPNLVETVKGYAKHEQETLELVIQARNQALAATGSPESQAAVENTLVHSLKSLLALSEGYPELKANQNFLELQKELTNTEDRIQAARRFYNGNVRALANLIETFPSNLVATVFGFQKREFFEIDEAVQRNAPQVDL